MSVSNLAVCPDCDRTVNRVVNSRCPDPTCAHDSVEPAGVQDHDHESIDEIDVGAPRKAAIGGDE